MIAEIREVKFSIGRDIILDHVSIEVKEGSFFVLFGADDAGKTTLLNLLCGFCRPDEGSVEVCGQNPFGGTMCGRKLRFVPDDIIWEDGLTGRSYLNYCRENTPYYKEETERELCELFHLPLDQGLTELTYAENKMIQIVGAISAAPDLLVLDEPGNFLDQATYRQLLDCLEAFCGKGMTILVAEEAYETVRTYGTHYAYLKEGKLVASAEAPRPDYRKKVVIVHRPNRAETGQEPVVDSLPAAMEQCIAIRRGREYYLYGGNLRRLYSLVLAAGCEDLVVEELTLAEELDQDYTRWT